MTTPHDERWADCEIVLDILEEELRGRVRVPKGAVHLADLLPVLYSLADALVGLTARMLAARGKAISCQAGCAACCRLPVPVAPSEAVHLARCVDAMPSKKQQTVRERFARALERLSRGGILDRMAERMKAGHLQVGDELATAYLAEEIACPFLEEGQCAIYTDRPAVCREHMVASLPSHCSESGQEIERVLMPARVSSVLFRLKGRGILATPQAIPLVDVLAWAERHPSDLDQSLPGPQLLSTFLSEFSRSQLRS